MKAILAKNVNPDEHGVYMRLTAREFIFLKSLMAKVSSGNHTLALQTWVSLWTGFSQIPWAGLGDLTGIININQESLGLDEYTNFM